MKLEKDAVTILGFIGIFLLLTLIIAPPVLRLMFGDEVDTNSNNLTVVEKLSCEKKEILDNYNLITAINTVYVNKKINKITFTYTVEFTSEGISDSNVYIDEFEMLRQNTNAKVKTEINKYIVEFDYAQHDLTYDAFLSKYSSSLSDQKIFYNNNSYSCMVIN